MNDIVELRRRTFARFLLNKRVRANLTQREVSEHFGWKSAQFVSNWERGISLPPFETMPKLAAIFNVPAEEFIAAYSKYEGSVVELHHKDLKRRFKAAS